MAPFNSSGEYILKKKEHNKQKETGMYYMSLENINRQIKAELFCFFHENFMFQKMTDNRRNIISLQKHC